MAGELDNLIVRENVRVHAAEAAVFDRLHGDLFNAHEQRRLHADLDLLCPGVREAADIGAGTGNITLKLLDRGVRVTAVDLSAEMLSVLRARAAGRAGALRVVHAGVDSFLDGRSELPPLVTLSSVLHHLPDPWRTLRALCALLPRGGTLYMTHEPTGIAPAPHLRLLDLGERVVWSAVHPRLSGFARSVDYSVSDHHAREGFAPASLRSFLTGEGLEVTRITTYGRAKFAGVARLASALGGATAMTVIARKG